MKHTGNRSLFFRTLYSFAFTLLVIGMASFSLELQAQDNDNSKQGIISESADDDGLVFVQPFEPDDETTDAISTSDGFSFDLMWSTSFINNGITVSSATISKVSLCILYCSLKLSFC